MVNHIQHKNRNLKVGGLSINCKCDACSTVQFSNVKFHCGDKKEAKPVEDRRLCTQESLH